MNPRAELKQVTGVISNDLWYFLCCTDKVGLRVVSLQQAHALRMILAEGGKKEEKQGREGGERHIRQAQRSLSQVELGSNSLRPDLMYGEERG